jgi:probable O-glycosylation ligase (exosortase A-associated)
VFELALFGFLAGFLALGIRRPVLWVLAYLYVDIVAPQKISWLLLASLPISLIVFVAAFGGWLLADDKRGVRFTFRQTLIVLLLVYCGYTTLGADFPVEAARKWDWVWKALVFAVFLPLTLRTRLRIEAAALVMVLSAATIIIDGGMKTALGGGGYGVLHLLVDDNTGLYEGSTLSMVAIAIIPLIVWLAKHGTIYPSDWRVKLFAAALILACLLIPVGTQTRTGLLCIAVLGVLMLRSVRHRFLYMALIGAAGLMTVPFLPQSYLERMSTIENHQGDESASTRLAVWKWTWQYAKDHPFGGGFDSFRGNKIHYKTTDAEQSGDTTEVQTSYVDDQARAFHSAYFELLGEQGYPGLFIWLLLQATGLIQLERVRRNLRRSEDPRDRTDAALATALQSGQVIYLVGAFFIGVGYQPFIYMLIGLQIVLAQQVRRRTRPPARLRVRPPLKPMPSLAMGSDA